MKKIKTFKVVKTRTYTCYILAENVKAAKSDAKMMMPDMYWNPDDLGTTVTEVVTVCEAHK